MPVFVLALTNPAFYLAAIMKTVTLGQQAGSTNAPFGRTGVGGLHPDGSMDGGAGLVRPVAAAEPVDADVVDGGGGALGWRQNCSGSRPRPLPPSFWRNALVTMLILLGPAIEDTANGKDVYAASAIRVGLFVGVALYAWATVWALERWRAVEIRSTAFQAQLNKGDRTMLMNLMIGLPIMLLCLALQAACHVLERPVLHAAIQAGCHPVSGLIAQIRPLLIVMIAMMLGNFVQIVIWGVLFICLGEFSAAV